MVFAIKEIYAALHSDSTTTTPPTTEHKKKPRFTMKPEINYLKI